MHIFNGEVLYDPGDRVTVIRHKLIPNYIYPTGHKGQNLSWVRSMEKYCGKTVTISQRIDGCKYSIKEDNGYWVWCNTFFEDPNCFGIINSDDEEVETPNIAKFLNSFCVHS